VVAIVIAQTSPTAATASSTAGTASSKTRRRSGLSDIFTIDSEWTVVKT
jgi:hypothetical protein